MGITRKIFGVGRFFRFTNKAHFMHVVIFRAQLRHLDAEYMETAAQWRELAFREFGCLAFHSVAEDNAEITVSYWPTASHIERWKAHPVHAQAQQRGRERWYASYSVDIAEVKHSYDVPQQGRSDLTNDR